MILGRPVGGFQRYPVRTRGGIWAMTPYPWPTTKNFPKNDNFRLSNNEYWEIFQPCFARHECLNIQDCKFCIKKNPQPVKVHFVCTTLLRFIGKFSLNNFGPQNPGSATDANIFILLNYVCWAIQYCMHNLVNWLNHFYTFGNKCVRW